LPGCKPCACFALRSPLQAQEWNCDGGVIASGSRASDYADILFGSANNCFPATAGLALAMAKRSSLHHRIQLILDRTMRRKKLTLFQIFVLGCVVIGLAAPLALAGIGPASASAAAGGEPAVSDLQKRLDEIRIEKIDFTEATLEEGTDYLRRVIAEQGHDPVNLVVLSSVMATDRHRETVKRVQMEKLRAQMAGARREMIKIEGQYAVIADRELLMRELSRARAQLEESQTELEIMESMSPVEIAISHPEAEFVRAALELVLASEGGSEKNQTYAQQKLEKRCEEYIGTLKKRIDGRERAYARLEEKVAQARQVQNAYAEAERQYQDAQTEIMRLADPGTEEQSGAQLVSLQLQDISLAAALKYIAQQAGVELSVEAEAVVFGERADFDEPETEADPAAREPDDGELHSNEEVPATPDPPSPDGVGGEAAESGTRISSQR